MIGGAAGIVLDALEGPSLMLRAGMPRPRLGRAAVRSRFAARNDPATHRLAPDHPHRALVMPEEFGLMRCPACGARPTAVFFVAETVEGKQPLVVGAPPPPATLPVQAIEVTGWWCTGCANGGAA
ncbi:hypothetical protein GCM10022248_93800 [Nonomuraea soli]